MTCLVVDLGNTHWKMAVAANAEIGVVAGGLYDDRGALDVALMARRDDVDGVLLASVADPAVAGAVVDAIETRLGLPVRRINATDPVPGVVAGYRKPEQLGVDRLLAMVAARHRVVGPLCVIDAGTAVTIDFVDAGGGHRGGFILPGQHMARDCLFAGTAIPRDDQVDETALLGRDTPTAVALGARYAVVGVVERFVGGPAALFPGKTVQVVVGGGGADRLAELLPGPCIRVDNLVLRGLAIVAEAGGS